MEQILQVSNLCKTYSTGKKVVDKLNFTVQSGEILGFLGPNGAGKSTTINIISTLLQADSGQITYFGAANLSIKQIKQQMGIVPQELAIYEDMSAIRNVKFFASLYRVPKKQLIKRVNQALEIVGLSDNKDELPATFSGGMKRRLNIACAIAHSPKLIIFDEPTVGIDPQSRNHILESIIRLRDQGATIIYTTHYMEEVQAICDQVLIMDGGKILAEGAIEQVLQQFNPKINYQIGLDKPLTEKATVRLKNITGVAQLETNATILRLTLSDAVMLSVVLTELIQNGYSILDVKKTEASLEQVFLDLTGKKLRD
ncbi:ABC transporter ATP-binding protein [Lactobacillus sp. XV13L]|nr:ABC transporter ATP-binding protein [Lactobacillus sp. XV13L]